MNDFFFQINTKPQNQAEPKSVLVILKKSDNDVINRQLLEKIMAALKFSLVDDCHLYEVEEDLHLSNVIKGYQKIIVFGLEPKSIGLNMPYHPYKINQLEDRKLLFSHTLGELKIDDKKKGILWKSLQVMFDLVKN